MARLKTGGIQQRSENAFRISYYDANHIRQFETITGTIDDAKRELANRLAEIASGLAVSPEPNRVLFGELAVDVINDYRVNKRKSVDDINARFRKHILPVFGKCKASQITTANLKAYILHRQNQNPTPAIGTINRELEAIRHAFKLALQGRRLLTMPHVPHLKENNTRSGFFTRVEVDRLCSHLPAPIDMFVLFAFLTGWRHEEIRGLTWRNIDFDGGEIRLDAGTTKSGEGRVFPMNAEVRTILRAMEAAQDAARNKMKSKIATATGATLRMGFVFSSDGKTPMGAFRKTWKTACYKAGLPCVVEPIRIRGKLQKKVKVVKSLRIFHDLRRSAAREFQKQGFTEGQIMKLCGWKTRSVFDRYAIVTDADLREKMEAIDGAKNGAKSAAAKAGTQ